MFCLIMGVRDETPRQRKKTITLSVNEEVHDLFRELTIKEIEVGGRRISIKRPLTDIYNRALEYAVENIGEWLR